jgi:exopolyphosphatase/guanosine-5'-triphosphate,3'-diphosphate pyrophosphatase
VENPSNIRALKTSSNTSKGADPRLAESDEVRDLRETSPLAIVDIGSNSVRLVAYESLSRAPRPIFNEKALCALGDGVASTGRLKEDAIKKALAALRRFRALSEILGISELHVIATAAARDTSNGPEFLAAAEQAIGAPITLLSGAREAELSALGVVSGINNPDGIVGDLGGGSLELIDVAHAAVGMGTSLPLGGLSLMDASKHSPRAALKIAREALAKSKSLARLKGRTFYAVGGTWRALAKLHMSQRNYPLRVIHGYTIPARDAADFAALVERVNTDTLVSIETVNAARRPLLAYGAVVLDEIIRQARPSQIMISANGVREGLLYEMLDAEQRRQDPLLVAAASFNSLSSRAPRHAEDLCAWTDGFMKSTNFDESAEEKRLRHAAALLADVNWRAHPDYRSEESLNLVENVSFTGIDHAGRSFLALAAAYRYQGLDSDVSPQLRALLSSRLLDKARILAAAMRVAYLLSGAMPDVLPKTPMCCVKAKLILTLPQALADLASDRLFNHLKQLARLIGHDPTISIAG